ncbi:unnamed protein product [Lactuca virosa]|uniref:Uncharacterized protein n=1 Tax=Lactuca virosa TaxID=75947 RepID=A0AAU9PSC6_9ASTR|nr:unnamed protein product [Lactuca virosa]
MAFGGCEQPATYGELVSIADLNHDASGGEKPIEETWDKWAIQLLEVEDGVVCYRGSSSSDQTRGRKKERSTGCKTARNGLKPKRRNSFKPFSGGSCRLRNQKKEWNQVYIGIEEGSSFGSLTSWERIYRGRRRDSSQAKLDQRHVTNRASSRR